jgi:ATP synthase protein I
MAVGNQFSAVRNIILMQVLIAILLASGFFMIDGWKNALSPALGSIVALLPNCYFALKMYLNRHREAKFIVRSFYTGESAKLLLTAALFAMVLQIPNINFMTLMIGYIAVLSVFWLALIVWRE